MSVEDLLKSKGLDYVISGKDYRVRCINPEHDDRDPSLRVDSITGIFHCFSCGFKGNIFTHYGEKGNYLQITRDLLKRKINKKLAENIGLTLPKGYIPFNKQWRNISADTYAKFEAFEHHDPAHVGRVVFPIRSVSGKIVGFNGRALSPEKQPKYMITPAGSEFPLFPTRVKPINGRVIIVEGIFDMLNLHDKGLSNTVCAFGTKKVTKEKLTLLKVQGITGIDIFFDPDEAGNKATEEVSRLAESLELTSRKVAIKSGDPGELTAQKVLKLKEMLYG